MHTSVKPLLGDSTCLISPSFFFPLSLSALTIYSYSPRAQREAAIIILKTELSITRPGQLYEFPHTSFEILFSLFFACLGSTRSAISERCEKMHFQQEPWTLSCPQLYLRRVKTELGQGKRRRREKKKEGVPHRLSRFLQLKPSLRDGFDILCFYRGVEETE